ncbi:MAG: tripartite tricarboxylate transporter substrate binding protein [Acetobacteraceae bacterium]|nr:tripartite tricarboxylate transporter substrate binding protein [Acetobacteraceae bacterium]
MLRRRAALLLPAALLAAPAGAQPWSPERPVRLIVPFAPGGSQDILGRLFAEALRDILGQQVVVDNRGGAGGIVGAEAVARAAPDGHTLLLATAGQTTLAKALGRRLPYDPLTDLLPVVQLVDSPVALVVAPGSGITTAAELVARARTARPPLAYASTGVGTNTHLIMEDLAARMGFEATHVPYRGAAAAFNDLVAGRVPMMFVSVPSVLGAQPGQLRVLGVTSRERFPALPEVPTLIEAGIEGFEASIWTGIALPAGTPPPVVARWREAFVQALGTELVRSRLGVLGATPVGGTTEAFAALLREDYERWRRVAAPLDIPLD